MSRTFFGLQSVSDGKKLSMTGYKKSNPATPLILLSSESIPRDGPQTTEASVFINPAPPPSTYGVEIALRFVRPDEMARPYHGLRVGSQRKPQFCGERERKRVKMGEKIMMTKKNKDQERWGGKRERGN